MNNNDYSSDYTAFTDCGSETVVIRIPYAFCVELVKNAPETEGRRILVEKLKRCRSTALKKLMEGAGL